MLRSSVRRAANIRLKPDATYDDERNLLTRGRFIGSALFNPSLCLVVRRQAVAPPVLPGDELTWCY